MVAIPRGGAAKESLTRMKTTFLLELHQIQPFATIGPRKNSKIFPRCMKAPKLLSTSLEKTMTAFSSWLNKATLTGQRKLEATLMRPTRFTFCILKRYSYFDKTVTLTTWTTSLAQCLTSTRWFRRLGTGLQQTGATKRTLSMWQLTMTITSR